MSRTVRTTCPYCAVQCNFDVVLEDNLAVKMAPTRECPVAGGTVCKKGLSAHHDLRHPERLQTPLLRIDGELTPVSWERALGYVAEALGPLVRGRPAGLGVFGSGALTNEKTYLLGKLARVAFGTPNIDYNGRYCMSSAATALNRSFGLDRGLGFPLSDIARSDFVLLVGANIAETLPPVMQFLKACKDRGGQIASIDPRATPGQVHLHLAPRPGTDHLLAGGLLHLMRKWGKIVPNTRARGMEAVLASVATLTPQRVAAECGVELADFMRLAERYAAAHTPLILSGRGPEQQSNGTDTVSAFINLAFLCGHFGKAGGGYGTLTGQGNGQGGREHGQKNDQLPGYRSLRNPADRAHMAGFWGVPESSLPGVGYSAQELFLACGDEVEALIIIGSNPAVSAPGAAVVRERLKALKHLIVIDFLPSETAQLATLVLPGSMWAEEEGTTTNLEGRVQRRRRAMTAPGEAREDWRILCDLARAVGRGEKFQYPDFRALQDEFFAATRGGKADYSGLSAERLDARSYQWPVPHAAHPGTPYPYGTDYPTPDGAAQLVQVAMTAPQSAIAQVAATQSGPIGAPGPLTLTTGRVSNHYQSGTQSRRNPALRGEAEVQLHPDTARARGIVHGQPVRLTGESGETVLPANVTPRIRPGVAFVAFHWPLSANELTSAGLETLDPHSRMPAFKLSRVQAAPLPQAVSQAAPATQAPPNIQGPPNTARPVTAASPSGRLPQPG